MTQIVWNTEGARLFEVGVDRGVLYPDGGIGVPWNGLVSVTQTPAGGATTAYYIDGVKYYNSSSAEEFAATIEAYTYPDEFDELDGLAGDGFGLLFGEQGRKPFGLSYRTSIGNDLDGTSHGYKIHLVYNALSSPSQRGFQTISEDVDPVNFSWAISTTPISIPNRRPTAHLVVDSRKTDPVSLRVIEEHLYGTEVTPPRMLTPLELIGMMGQVSYAIVPDEITGIATLVVSDMGDLIGSVSKGLFSAPPTTRLTPTDVPGINTLED